MLAKRNSRSGTRFIKPQYSARSIGRLEASPQRLEASPQRVRTLAASIPLAKRQPERACQRPQQIRSKIIQPGIAARQKPLMPFIDQAQQQRAGHSQEHHAQAGATAREPNGGTDQREKCDMRELIPGGRNQIHRKGLCAADQKRAGDRREQHRRNNARVA